MGIGWPTVPHQESQGRPAWHPDICKEPTAVGGQAGTLGSWILTLALTPGQSTQSPGLTVTFPFFLFEKIASTDFFVCFKSNMFIVVFQLLSRPPCTAALQAPLSSTISPSLLRFMSNESVMPSNHFILCHPLLLLPLIFPSIRVFSRVSSLHQVAKILLIYELLYC